ncbi:MAG: ketoacyl-ACP synthase III [candidate division KSB1 bacterium]|nr:ketoacyl-ACP synthase III [candidate division KSB1 bacterium]MDZ7341627.1 ketoacyl-ACP synthase III [candidate division KSB1 bacterium]
MPRNAVIRSTGSYAPEWTLPNHYFNELLGEDVDSWLIQNLTIRERHWCRENESTADLCLQAAQRALENANLPASKLDLILVATDTPEYISPSTAAVVQYRLGAVNAGAFDINTACAGFVTGLDVASKYVQADSRYEQVLVIGVYAMSKYLDKQDKKTVTLFADGAGAVILGVEKNTSHGFLASELITQGQYHDWMGIYAGGTKLPLSTEVLQRKDHLLKFVRKFPKEINPQTWAQMIRNLCDRLHIHATDVDHYFFTQININSIHQTLDHIGVPRERAHTIMDRYAYTGSACIPMAFDDAIQQGKVKPNDLIFFIGSGGGLAFASAAFIF